VKKATPEPKKAAKKDESSDDSDSDSEDEKPAKKAPAKQVAPAKKAAAKKEESSDDEDSSEDEKPKKATPAKKEEPKKAAAKKEESSDDDDSSEDEKPKKATPAKKEEPKKAAAKKEESSDDDDSSEDEKPAAKKAKAADGKAAKTKNADSDDDEESDAEMKTNNKRKAPEAAEGSNTRVFLGGLPFKASQDDIKKMFSKCGKIKTIELPQNAEGRPAGFGFLTFEDVSAVAKAVAMDGQELMGRWLKVKEADGNDGKPKHGGTPNGDPKPKPEGCTSIFMGNLSWDVDEDTIRSFFAECGEIISVRFATDRETGDFKGFGHVSFAETEATDLAVAKAGEFVAGRAIRVDFAEDRKAPDSGGGGRGGFGGRGRGGGRGGGGRGGGGFGSGGRGGGRGGGSTPVNKNKGSIVASSGSKISFDD
jgi:nucleolin